MQNPKCFYQLGDRTYAILNWRNRNKPEDVLCLAELTTTQRHRYATLSAEGRPEPLVYEALFPPPPKPKPRLPEDLSHLKKDQLVVLIRALTGHKLGSISRMTRRDIEVVARLSLGSLAQRSSTWVP